MDGARFDRWTRALARQADRRRVVAAFVAGLGVAAANRRSGSAQTGLLGSGEPCTATEQCSQEGGPRVCANNGIAQDGPLNCCRVDGGACSQPADCCGVLQCVAGFCVSDEPATASGGLPLQAACSETAECAASAGGVVVCGDNGIAVDGPLNCCLEEGSPCTADAECCGMFFCTGGVCGESAGSSPGGEGGGDLAPGQFCVTSSECSQALGPAICGRNSTDAGADLVCCLEEASPCTDDLECCGDAVCADNGIGSDGGINCCGYAGATCTVDAGCCADLFCQSGTCQPL